MLCDLGQISSPFCVSVPATYNLGGSLQWSGGQPAQRLCHLSDIARSLSHAVACSPFAVLRMAGICAMPGMSLRQAGQKGNWQPLPIWIPYKAARMERLNSYLRRSGRALFIAPLPRVGNWPAAAYTVGVIQQSGWYRRCPL